MALPDLKKVEEVFHGNRGYGLTYVATVNAKFKLVIYNFLHQLYLTSQNYNSINIKISNATLLRVPCYAAHGIEPKLHNFGMTKIMDTQIPLDAGLCLLGNLNLSHC